MENEEEYFYFVRKLKPYWGSRRYEYVMHKTLGRARGSVKSSFRQGGRFLEPVTIFRVPVSAFEELESYDESVLE